MTVQSVCVGPGRKPERWFSHYKVHLVVFSDGSQCGFRRIMSLFLHRPNFLKLTHVDIYTCTVYFLEVPLFVIKYMYAMIIGSESEKKGMLNFKKMV